jgi:predicted transcriptional regulator
MASRKKSAQLVTALAFASALLPGVAGAIPKEGSDAPNARLVDVEGRELKLGALRGKPVLIVYEDKESSKQNQPLKSDLSQLAKGDRYKSRMNVTAVADVSSYDFWPAKGFVKDAIKEEMVKHKTTIYCDWDGSFRKALGLRSGMSNVVLLSAEGKVLFAGEGTLNEASRKRLISLIGDQLNH